MKKAEASEIIDADSSSIIQPSGRKSAVTVSVPYTDEIIDCDRLQIAGNAVKPRVCEDVIVA